MTEPRPAEPPTAPDRRAPDRRAPDPVADDAGLLARIGAAVREAHARSVPF